MKNWIFAFGVLVCICACNKKPKLSQNIENEIVEKLIDWNLYIDSFKFKKLKSFELTDKSFENATKIANTLFFKVTQDSLP